jgi:hypothetical protein
VSFFCKIISISVVLLSGAVFGGELTELTEIQTAQLPINSSAINEVNQNSDFPLDGQWKDYVEECDHPLKALMLTRASFAIIGKN